MLIARGHESVLEHAKISVRIVCDRGVSHEIVRHRIASYSQESTRYCNYSHSKFGGEITFIRPIFWLENSAEMHLWEQAMQNAEDTYNELLKSEATPEMARSVLPNSLKTEVCTTMNLRAWRHFFKLRTAKAAHIQMREVACMLLAEFLELLPCVFEEYRPNLTSFESKEGFVLNAQ
jgi:thymidylate synthase (FAD)